MEPNERDPKDVRNALLARTRTTPIRPLARRFGFKEHLAKRLAIFLVGFVFLSGIAIITVTGLTLAPTVQTDKPDYAPGSTVTVTGQNWAPGENVTLTFHEDDGDPDTVYVVAADSDGKIFDKQFIIKTHDLGVHFTLTASSISGNTATTTFTDGPGVNLDQCQNIDLSHLGDPCGTAGAGHPAWVNGNINRNNSAYREGDGIPYRLAIADLPDGTYGIGLSYDFTKGGIHAFDRLTGLNLTQAADPCKNTDGSINCSGSPLTFTIPGDVSPATLPNSGVLHIAGDGFLTAATNNMSLWLTGGTTPTMGFVSAGANVGADLANSYSDGLVAQDGLSSGDSTRRFAFKITLTGCTPNCNVMIGFTAHVSSSLPGISGGWGAGQGTANINGSGFHVSVDGVGNALPLKSGNQDRGIKAGDEVIVQTITVNKVLVPTADPGLFNLQVIDGDMQHTTTTKPNVTNGGTTGFLTVTSGANSTVTEAIGSLSPITSLSDYNTNIKCDDEDPATPTLDSGVQIALDVFVTPGSNWICTIKNTRRPKLTVLKVLSPSDDTGKFNLSINGTQYATNVGDGGSTNAQFANIGDNTFSEAGGTGTPLTDYTSVISGDGCGGSATAGTITLAAGANKTCTITNTRNTGSIELKKAWVGTAGQTTLNIGTAAAGIQTASQQTGVAGATPLTTGTKTVDTGTFYVSETGGLTDYSSALACTDNGSPVTPGADNSLSVGTDHAVICTFTNTRNQGTIELKKAWSGTAGQTTLNIGTAAAGIQTASQQTGVAGATPLTTGTKTVNTGIFYVSETGGLTNYSSSLACTDNGSPVTPGADNSLSVATGHAVICTFTNTRNTGTIEVQKALLPTTDPGMFNLLLGTTVKTAAGGVGNNGTTGTVTVDTGTYSVAENTAGVTTPTNPADYTTVYSCTLNGNPLTSGSGTSISSLVVAKNDAIVCKFTNTRKGRVSVVKTVNGSPDATKSFTFDLRQGASTNADGTSGETLIVTATGTEVTFTSLLLPGQHYQICEQVFAGWNTTLGPNLFVPSSIIPPSLPNPNVNNLTVCTDFVAQPGQTPFKFTVDNSSPPGGRALTIGFWKNWASCTSSSANKKPILDQTLAAAQPTGEVVSAENGSYPAFAVTSWLVLHGSTTSPNVAPDCSKAVNLLNKTTIDGKTKSASDPAFNLAAQLLAAELNFTAGAAKNGTVVNAVNQAVLLLGKYHFNGLTHTKISAADETAMNNLAKTLDDYNNNR